MTTIQVVCGDKQLPVKCNWDVGIGGSVWSTGLELIEHVHEVRDFYNELFANKVILELGAGTGLVGLAIAVSFAAKQVIVTDNEEHLAIIQENVDNNTSQLMSPVSVECWTGLNQTSLFHHQTIDIILATDVVYHPSLFHPFIQTIMHLMTPATILIMGITRSDTDRSFFDLLLEHGFTYRKIPEYNIPKSYKSTNFGLFIVKMNQ